MGEAYREIGLSPNEINLLTYPRQQRAGLVGGTLVLQGLDALLDKSDSIGFLWEAFGQCEIGLIF
jgi:hypothetical protein